MKKATIISLFAMLVPVYAGAQPATMQIVPADQIEWGLFNPEDPEGPQVAPISGDFAAGPIVRAMMTVPAGHMNELHTHSSAYIAVVVQGVVGRGSNPDALTELPQGSYWVQPAGEPHMDGCVGDVDCIVYFEMYGAVDNMPAEAAAEGEPQMIHVTADTVTWGPMDPAAPDGPQVALLHGDMEAGPSAMLLAIPQGFDNGVHHHTSVYTAVVVSGGGERGPDGDNMTAIPTGSYWIQPGLEGHQDRCTSEGGCVVLVSFDGPFDNVPGVPE